MDILLIAAIVFITLIALGYPIVNAKKYRYAGLERGSHRLDTLENARVQTLDAIRDLQFDHLTGKLSDGDYQSLRSQYEFQAAKILQQLDALKGQPKKIGGGQVCSRCHARNDATDKFCVKCGAKLQAFTRR